MTEAEWYSLIDKTLNAEEGAAAVVQLKDAVTEILTNSANLTNSVNTLTSENNRLRDSNAQLALRVTASIDPVEPPAVDTPEVALESLINELKGAE